MRRMAGFLVGGLVFLSGCGPQIIGRYQVATTKNLQFEGRESELAESGVVGRSGYLDAAYTNAWWEFRGDYTYSVDRAIHDALQRSGGDYMRNVVVERRRTLFWPIIILVYEDRFIATGDVYRFKPLVPGQRSEGGSALPPAPGIPVESPYDAAVRLYTAQEYAKAEVLVNQVLAASPDDWKAWQMLGNCRFAQGNQPGAVQAYRRSLELNPANADLQQFVDGLPAE